MEKVKFPKFAIQGNAVNEFKPKTGATRYQYKLSETDLKKARKMGFVGKDEDSVWVSGLNFSGYVQFGLLSGWTKPTWMNFVDSKSEEKKSAFYLDKARQDFMRKKQLIEADVKDGILTAEEGKEALNQAREVYLSKRLA